MKTSPEQRPRLLMADDNPAVLSHASAMLQEGFEIVAVSDGDAVLRRYQEVSPDVIVLDITMGRLSGLDVARLLQEKGSETPIVFLTVHQGSDFVSEAFSSGGSAYVLKSHMGTDLLRAIDAAMSGESFVSRAAL